MIQVTGFLIYSHYNSVGLLQLSKCVMICFVFFPQPGKAHLEKHYEELKDKPFFKGLVEYMNSGPIFAMVRSEPTSPFIF